MSVLIFFYLFIIGLCVGSFLNVLIDRLPREESPFKGRSHCDHCKHTLAVRDLVPVVSYLTLQGRCRYCRKTISLQNPLIELITGIIFVATFLFVLNQNQILLLKPITYNLSPLTFFEMISLLIVFCSFLVMLVTDMKEQILPDETIISAGMGSILYGLASNTFSIEYMLGALLGFFLFYFLYKITCEKGIGFGDVKLVIVFGLLLGVGGLIVALYIAFLTGAAVSTILILSKQKKWGQKIAFGPFLIGGAIISFFYAQPIINWYAMLFLI